MMTPINRIPLDATLMPSLEALVQRELEGRDTRALGDLMIELADHAAGNETHISITLDWAMEIRDRMGISWAECIDAAMILYFG